MPKQIKNGDSWSSKSIYSKQTRNKNMVQYIYGLSYQSKNGQRVDTVRICPKPGTGFPMSYTICSGIFVVFHDSSREVVDRFVKPSLFKLSFT